MATNNEAPRILMIEGLQKHSDGAINALQHWNPNVVIQLIEAEHDFRISLPQIIESPPNLVVTDIMVPWCKASSDMPKPDEDVAREGFYTAGLRSQTLLSRNPATQRVPVLLWAMVDREDFDRVRRPNDTLEGVYLLKKCDDEQLRNDQLTDIVAALLSGREPRLAIRLTPFEASPLISSFTTLG